MSRTIIARYIHPWKFRREQERLQRVAELRARDGDDCRRCRRPMRFDLPGGHDLSPSIEDVVPKTAGELPALENSCLTHRRCNTDASDNTREVQERVRRKGEAELLSRTRKQA